jgi:response regulator RpfG family c-di-GMP phosphodiesterase
VNQRRHFTLRLVPINMLISTNIASIRLIKRTKDADGAEDKAHTEDIVQGIHNAEKDTREVIKEIKHSDKKKCYICDQLGCWSTKHTTKERLKAYQKFRQ